MRYLQTESILNANQLISMINATDYTINFDIFTCKYTKKQKKLQNSKGKFFHIINSLKMCFRQLNETNFKQNQIKPSTLKEIKEEVEMKQRFIPKLNKTYEGLKNWNFSEDVLENYSFSDVLDIVIKKEMNDEQKEFFKLESRASIFENDIETFCYFIYSKKLRRVIILSRIHSDI